LVKTAIPNSKTNKAMLKYLFIGLYMLLVLSACTKTEEQVITSNKPPPDKTIPGVQKINFINKTYIGLLGREPDQLEFDQAKSILDLTDFSVEGRTQLLDTILKNDAFFDREYELTVNDLLNGLDTFQINDNINTLAYLLTLPSYEPQWPLITIELNRLVRLKEAPFLLKAGLISIKEMQRRCVDNLFFDQINMGSLNFVIASFQHLLLRNPTSYESQEGVKMVDGINGILFLAIGDSKTKFLELFFASNDYYEGQVKILFNRFYFRNPNSEESARYVELYKSSGNYVTLLKTLLSSSEFAGIN
jgi:hypothetical protein